MVKLTSGLDPDGMPRVIESPRAGGGPGINGESFSERRGAEKADPHRLWTQNTLKNELNHPTDVFSDFVLLLVTA